MPKKTNKLKAWSFSRWHTAHTCRYKFKCSAIDGIRDETSSPAMERGTRIHKLAEEFVKGNIFGMPKELQHFNAELKVMQKLYKKQTAFTEEDWGFDENWKPCSWKTAWFRAKMDFYCVEEDKHGTEVALVDYKTGQIYSYHDKQAKLYAVAACHRLKADFVHVEFMYTDKNHIRPFDFNSADCKRLNTFWNNQAAKLFSMSEFPKEPGSHCKYCHVRSDKAGDCTAWKKVK